MPSPFPGMDPYLEAPDLWPDFHDALAGEIRGLLNRTLPAPYYARLEMRPEIGIVDEGGSTRRIVPDVSVALNGPRTAISEFIEVTVRSEPLRHLFVEIRDPARGHQLVTLIEIASPSNKRQGEDRRTYLREQREVLESTANLIELDLLRGGERLIENVGLGGIITGLEPAPDYLVLVNRSWKRGDPVTAYQIFRILLTDMLPVIPVPLREHQEEVPLDLQYACNRAYDSGPYLRGAVDYSQATQPPLQGEAITWSEQLLRERGLVPRPAG